MSATRFLFMGITLILAGACANSPPADPAALQGLTRAFTTTCVQEAKSDAEMTEMLRGLDLTGNQYCDCLGQSVFGSFTQNDLNKFMRDAVEYGDNVGYQQPWRSRIETGVLRCFGEEGQITAQM